MGEMVNCATVFKHKFVFRNANMFLLSILIKKKTFCLISESSWAKKEGGYKQKGKQSVSPQLKLSAVNKGLQSAVGQPQTALFISSLINSSPLFFSFWPKHIFSFGSELFHYDTTKPVVLPSGEGASPVEKRGRRRSCGFGFGSRRISAAFDPSFPMTSTKEWARAALRIVLCYCSPKTPDQHLGSIGVELFYSRCTPGWFLYSAAMLCWVITLELGRDVSRSTSLQMTADSWVMTDLETIMTDNCLIRTGIYHENNYSDEARAHFSLGSPLFWPSPSCWSSAPSALPWVTHSGLFIFMAGVVWCTTRI